MTSALPVYMKTIFVPQDNLISKLLSDGKLLPVISLNIEQKLTKVTCPCDK